MSKFRFYHRLSFVLLLVLAGQGQALTYSAGISNSQWYLSSSIFTCQLSHDIPNFGKAVFEREAGGSLHFYLEPDINPMRPGKAVLVMEAPAWQPGASVHRLGYVRVSQKPKAVDVGPREATQMLAGLAAGMMPTLTRRAWYNNDPIRVRLSAVNFMSKLGDYRSCVSSLLPVNFQQVEKTQVFFGENSSKLTAKDKAELDKVILYVKADSTVTDVFVDGHTDRTGRRIYNRLLSKARAEAVTEYLTSRGVPASKITTRYHGERYPLSSHNQALNRRATVTLKRSNGSNGAGQSASNPPSDSAG